MANVLDVCGLEVDRGSVRALSGAVLSIERPGSVHALLGQNGSGKSTLLGVLAGQLRPLSGTVEMFGRQLRFGDPVGARRAGIATVSQELSLAPELTVSENVLMGRGIPKRFGALRWRDAHKKAAVALATLGMEVDTRTRTGDLPPDQQQLVEIARALAVNSKLLILDEPTSSLSEDKVADLFSAVRRLSRNGLSVILVSHRIPELYEICDSITVLRDGRTVLQSPIDRTTPQGLVDAMLGRKYTKRTYSGSNVSSARSPLPLDAQRIGSATSFEDITVSVGTGEIVGLAGLTGAGCSEVMQTIAGLRELSSGDIQIAGKPYRPRGVRDAYVAHVAYLPPDRKTLGLNLTLNISDNLALASTRDRHRLTPPFRARERKVAEGIVDKLEVKSAGVQTVAADLSGGNQQKVALGKCIVQNPKLLVLDEPSRGVDVAAREDIYFHLRQLAGQGMGIFLTSSDTSELVDLCQRVYVMHRHRIVAELQGSRINEETIAHIAGGALK